MLSLIPGTRRELGWLGRDMDTFLDRFLDEWTAPANGRSWTPSVDISETEEELRVTAELPGMEPEDIDIFLDDGVLTIKGVRKHESEDKDEKKNFYRVERNYGRFGRSFRLPADVEPEGVSAVYKDGVLSLVLPKSEKTKSRKIEVSTK